MESALLHGEHGGHRNCRTSAHKDCNGSKSRVQFFDSSVQIEIMCFQQHVSTSENECALELTKNDDDNDRPSEWVINSYLRKKIIKSMSDSAINKVIYALKELNIETIESIISLMKDSIIDSELELNLTIIQHKKFKPDFIDEQDFKIFNKIEYIHL